MYHLYNTTDTWENWLNDFVDAPYSYSLHDLERWGPVYIRNRDCIADQRVLDLGVNLGYTCIFASHFGAKNVVGIEARPQWLNVATKVIPHWTKNNIELEQGDVNNHEYLQAKVSNCDTVIALGLFYHLNNHYDFLKTICAKNVKALLLETTVIKEDYSNIPHIRWITEHTDDGLAGTGATNTILVGSPNLKWLETTLEKLNWRITDYYVTSDAYWNPMRLCITAKPK